MLLRSPLTPFPRSVLLPASRRLLAVLLLAAAWPAATGAAESVPPEGAEIRDLQVRNTPSDLTVSFTLHGAFSEEIREQIQSGLPVTFHHYLEIVQRRTAWFDNTLVKKTVSSTVTFDTLTRQYRMTRSVNEEVVETAVTELAGEMELFMAGVDRLRVCDPGELPGDRDLALRVKSRMRRRFVLFFIPWNFETSWARIGLHLPGADAPREAAPLP